MAKLLTILIFSTFLNSFLITLAISKKHSVTEVINALVNVVDYFKKNYQNLNFEAHFGLRVIEGQLKLLLTDYNDGKHRQTPANVMTQLRYLNGEAAKTANMAVPHLLEYDRRAFTSMRYQVEKSWIASHTHRLISNSLKLNVSKKPKEISEDDRNVCVAELTGASNNERHKCATTLNCLEMMSAKGQRGFSLQHQIFYTALAEQVGCKSAIEEYLASLKPPTNLEQLQRELCSSAYYELMKTVEYYGIQPSFAHLFLIMEFNCPSLGFFQFLTDDWLDLILTWQNSNGCTLGTNEPVTQSINIDHKKLPSRIIVQQEDQTIPKQELVYEIHNQNANQGEQLGNQPGNIKFQHPHDTAGRINPQPIQDQQNYMNNRYAHQIEMGSLNNNQGNLKFQRQQPIYENANSQSVNGVNNFHQQNDWFPNQNIHFSNMDYINQGQGQNVPNVNVEGQYHPHILAGSEEIAHAHKNTHVLYNQNIHDGSNVQEVVHNENDNPHQQNVVNKNYDTGINKAMPLFPPHNMNMYQHNNEEIHKQQRSLLQVKQTDNDVAEDDDHGYFFDREKHIGGNSSEKHVYLYYYPMHEQMKRINDVKERQQLKKAERQKKLHLQNLASRKLLKDTTGNCNMQLTGLAACALTMYIRFMIDPGPPEFHGLRLNKPEGQYDVGVRDSFEENEPEEQLYVPNNERNAGVNYQNMPSFHVKQRLYPLDGGFKPLYFGDVRKKLHPEENDDYVRKAESPKRLIDKAFESETRVLEKPSDDLNIKKKNKNITNISTKKVINTQNRTILFNSFFAKTVQISAFNKHLPTELGYHLLLIVIVSLVCVYILFRYFRFKRRSRFRTKYI